MGVSETLTCGPSSHVRLVTAERRARPRRHAHFLDEDIEARRAGPSGGRSGGAGLRSAAYYNLMLLLPLCSCVKRFGSRHVGVCASSAASTVPDEEGGAPRSSGGRVSLLGLTQPCLVQCACCTVTKPSARHCRTSPRTYCVQDRVLGGGGTVGPTCTKFCS